MQSPTPSLQRLPADAPVMVLLPGLTGGSEDSYVQHAVEHARAAGIRAVVFNSRGTSGSPVTTAQFYSSSYTEDLRWGWRAGREEGGHTAAGTVGPWDVWPRQGQQGCRALPRLWFPAQGA